MRKQFPERNNFYVSFIKVDKARVAEVFSSNGWLLRKSSWTDFELKNDWSELTLEGEEKEPLMNGIAIFDIVNVDKLDATLAMLEGHFVYEFYDESDSLLFKKEKGL
jgi:hypothetical protein